MSIKPMMALLLPGLVLVALGYFVFQAYEAMQADETAAVSSARTLQEVSDQLEPIIER